MLECENWVQDFHGHEMGYKKNFQKLGFLKGHWTVLIFLINNLGHTQVIVDNLKI
jgi:hypothetical protein